MNQLKDVYLFEHHDGRLVRVNVTEKEKFLGRKMSATLALLARDWLAKKGGEAVHESTLGTIRYREYRRGKRFFTVISVERGALEYKELRDWICLGVQYCVGMYPMMVIDMTGTTCEFSLEGWVSFTERAVV